MYALLIVTALVCFSCGKEPVLEKARKEYEEGRYREVVFLVRHHLRRGGNRKPELLFLAGKSWMRLGVEAEAEDAFAEVYSIDSTWAPPIAEALKEEATISIASGYTSRGKRFVLQAINYDHGVDFDRYNAIAGELLLEKGDFDGAIRYLGTYLERLPDTTGAAEVMMHLGAAYEGKGAYDEAVSLYRTFQEQYPKSRLKTTIQWKLENLLFMKAQRCAIDGEIEEAKRLLLDLVSSVHSPLVHERTSFLLGELFEKEGDIDRAVRYYTEVVNLNLGSSKRLVEKAKERIERLETERARY
ncbi:MAG: tetratricopeptide repeat protein [bacterium]|nr:MAG: tetratricopeptide repeat protein [bacterium]